MMPHHEGRDTRGFTLIELLMVLTILSILIGLTLPVLSSAREAGRRVDCLSRQRQIGLALIQETLRKGRYPASGTFSATGPEQYHSWVVPILDDLGEGALQAEWRSEAPHNDAATSKNARLEQVFLTVLVCPSDPSVMPGQGNLSYVVNGGFGWTQPVDCPISPRWASVPSPPQYTPLDLDGDGTACPPGPLGSGPDKRIYFQTGLFFVENVPYGSGTSRHHTPGDVVDGLGQTLLLTENVRAGFDPLWRSTWADPWPPRNTFFLSGAVCKDGSCKSGNVDYRRANDQSATEPSSREAINAALDQAEGEAPWPSSLHVGGVNVMFCDGHGAFLRQSIDGGVYAALMSPQGTRLPNPALNQPLPGKIEE